jgi:glycosyltransferase involved in cell wall biosynthesis
MLWGRQVCDGVLEADRCTRCRLHSLGLPKPLATLLARTPPAARAWGSGHQSGAWTALQMRDLVALQHAATRALFDEVDRIVVLCEWTRAVLVRNRVAPTKIVHVPHGFSLTDQEPVQNVPSSPFPGARRLVTLGRLEPVKGVDLLVHALAELPELPLTLDIYGIEQSEGASAFAAGLRAAIARDSRIRLLPPVPHSQVVSLLRQYDALLVPSLWLETGPLVVLEAFAAGVPVIGSNLGGIAEKVKDGVDGLLVTPTSQKAWRQALARLATEGGLLERLRARVAPPRSMEQVAEEMRGVYASLLESVMA